MLVAAVALLRANPTPDETAVADALGGVLCRCTGYRHIVEAVLAVSAGSVDTGSWGARAELGSPDVEAPDVVRPDTGPPNVGRGVARLDGAAKLDGSERFGDDVAPADALSVRLVRAPFHRAGFELGDLEAWRAAQPGVERVAVRPGRTRGQPLRGDPAVLRPGRLFAEGETRFLGEAVAAVVGERAALAALLLDDFPVRWEEREPCLTPERAQG